MEVWIRLLGKDLKMMKGWFLGGIAVMIAINILGAWIAYETRVGASSFLLSFVLFIHALYVPVYIWISLSKEWRGTYVYWLQFPQSSWTLLAIKLGSALISLCISYVAAFVMFYGINQMDLNSSKSLMNIMTGPDAFDIRGYVDYMNEHFFSVFSLVLYMNVVFGVWALLFNISIQAVRRRLHRFSGIVMFVIFAFLLWAEFKFSTTNLYSSVTKWGAFSGDSVWAYLEMNMGELLFDLPIMIVYFFLAGWLVERKVEV
ncbi:hypothetical protein [Aneurinibacillus uraniidurans]|uniref:hypothetical protein n=1 Tax=Aneurinibacillus uraniidurans TaxID=2966586 RepID=UPI0023497DEC|nr:hypothetical protein [Aneurinibacillus sp. B1]WCN38895.1 hypothetical protein PO771_05720 [Aneurinibacillus sp. B1]